MPEENNDGFDLKLRIQESLNEIAQRFIDHAPQIIGAALLFIIGLIAASILKFGANKLLKALNSLVARVPKLQNAKGARIRPTYTRIIGEVIYWTTLAIFVTASANVLGWNLLTQWLDSIVSFLPSLISGLLIVFVGLFVGNLARSATTATANRYHVKRSDTLGRVAQAIVIFGFTIVGIEQIGLNLHFLTNVFVVVIGILLFGAALSYGLGSQTLVANIIGIQRIRKHCSVGERLKIGDTEGEVIEFSQTSIILDAKDGRVVVPAKLFQEQLSRILNDSEEESQPPQTNG